MEPDFEKGGGMVPVIAQDFRSGEVLMLAYMNREAWNKTLESGYVHYWSRSRNRLWKKGETSGNVQAVREIRYDCDGDALLVRVEQVGGAACHTGHRSCFYRVYRNGRLVADGEKVFEPSEKYPGGELPGGARPGGARGGGARGRKANGEGT
jgi:phosphoribosyl-AMP cyclohydrolase